MHLRSADLQLSPGVRMRRVLSGPIFTLLLAAAGASELSAQSNSSPHGSRLTVGTDTILSFRIVGRDTTQTGRVIEELRIGELGGKKVIERLYRAERLAGASVDTLIEDFETLTPLRHRRHYAIATELLEFDARRARGTITRTNAPTIRIDWRLEPPTYSMYSLDLLMRGSPLELGWQGAFPILLLGNGQVEPMIARVVEAEYIDGVQCWRVEALYSGRSIITWITKLTRKVQRQEARQRDGSINLYRRASASQATP
jgi:hypothetical protein